MSLRRRIAGAAALSVAGVAVAFAVVGYVTTRSQLVGELQRELHARAAPYLQPHTGESGGGPSQSPGQAQPQFGVPSAPEFGAAPGYFQIVYPDGRVSVLPGETRKLPVDPQAVQIARSASGSSFTSTTVDGVHLEVLTVGDPYDRWAIQVALPLTGVDAILRGLLLPYGLLIAGGVLAALMLGMAISRSALAPIERFLRRTEDVSSDLARPQRLEESGPTELRRLAISFNRTLDALERSMQAQRHLVADASHELRTPMAALRSNIQIFLESDRLPDDERGELQQAIMAELDDLSLVVSDVLELARGAEPSGATEPVELDSLVREAVERTERRAPALRFELDVEPTTIVNSPDRVARAVGNVIDNARKWSPEGAVVEVSLHGGVLTVRDHGPGFDPLELDRIFERFYRSSHARRTPGSGLGLAIVKQAAEAHGGFAEAANAAGGGAMLRVSFGPVTAGPQAPAEATASPTEARSPAR